MLLLSQSLLSLALLNLHFSFLYDELSQKKKADRELELALEINKKQLESALGEEVTAADNMADLLSQQEVWHQQSTAQGYDEFEEEIEDASKSVNYL